jgi:O-antigen/teichoic acid export membrane protein
VTRPGIAAPLLVAPSTTELRASTAPKNMQRSSYRDEITSAGDDAHERQRRGTRQLLVGRGVFFASAYVVSAILTRSLGPTDYGVYGVVVSQLFWLEMVVHAGIPAATSKLMADGRHDPVDVERAARALLIVFSALLFVVCWFLARGVADLMRIPDGQMLFRIAILDLPFAAIYASYEGILYGRRQFGVLARAQIVYGAARVAAIAALTAIGLSIEWALVAIVGSSLIVCTFIGIQYPPRGFRINRRTMREIVRFAGPMALCLISGQVLVNLDLWALKGLWPGSGVVVGQYVASLSLARMLAVIPTVQAGVLFSSVAWASASRDNARAVRHIQEATRFALVIAAAPCVLLALNGSEVLSVLFSRPYAEGQRFLPFHLLGFGLFAVLDVFANALMAAGRHRVVAAVLTAAVPLVWVGNYFLIPSVGPAGAAITVVVGIGAATIVIGAIARAHFGSLVRAAMLTRVIVAAAVVGFASAAFHVEGPLVLLKLALLGGLYILVLYFLKEVTLQDLGLAWIVRRRSAS